MSWDYDLANALKKQSAPSPYSQNFYVATYANGDFVLMGGALRYGASQQIWAYEAKYYTVFVTHAEKSGKTYVITGYSLELKERAWKNGMTAAVLLDEKRNSILVLDALSNPGDILNETRMDG